MKTKKNYSPSVPHQDYLIKDLKNVKTAVAYLNAAIEDGDDEAFLLALHNVAEAQGGISRLARIAKIHRASIYRMMSDRGNPRLNSLSNVLHSLGFKLAIVPEGHHFKRAA
jgi:probable addiction module antidote protein